MSSGSHLSRDIYDLIKAIGETRSKVLHHDITIYQNYFFEFYIFFEAIKMKKLILFLSEIYFVQFIYNSKKKIRSSQPN
jgi:hypothetical protein